MATEYEQNRRVAEWRMTWLIGHYTSHQLLWYIGSIELRNLLLRKAAKHCDTHRTTDTQRVNLQNIEN